MLEQNKQLKIRLSELYEKITCIRHLRGFYLLR